MTRQTCAGGKELQGSWRFGGAPWEQWKPLLFADQELRGLQLQEVIPASHADLLTRPVLAHVATVGRDGTPQSNPVWVGFDGTFLRFSQVVGRQKEKNLARNPAIALSLVDPDDPYRYLEVRGTLDGIEDDSSLDFINSMAKKYLDVDRNPWETGGQRRIVMRIRPVRALTGP